MPGYSLVPVDYQPNFDDYSLVPVDYDPFAADGVAQQAQIQQARAQAQPQGPPQQQPATGAGQPDAGAPAAGGPSGSQGGGIGPPNPTLDQGAAKAPPFGGYSLVPVDYQPDFDDYSLVPVDYDPFAADGVTQQAQSQQPPTPTQPAQPQPQTQPQQPATGAGQPGVSGPATGNSPSGSEGGDGPSAGGSDAGGRPNPIPDQAEASGPLPFSGYANPSPTESLVNRQKMDDQEEVIKTDPNAGRVVDGGELYKFVTTKLPIAEYPIDGGTGWLFTANSPFYAFDGTRYGTIDASPERPVTVTIKEDGKFTISWP